MSGISWHFLRICLRIIRGKKGLVIAVEPGPDNYAILQALIPREVKVVNAAIWIEDGVAILRKGTSRNNSKSPA